VLNRVQGRNLLHSASSEMRVYLHGAQKAMAQWAIIDDYNTIIDLKCEDTCLLRALASKYSLRTCGIASAADRAKQLREEMTEAEIFCARSEDIPWKSGTFDAVFYRLYKKDGMPESKMLREALRVMKDGAQMLISMEGAPEIIWHMADIFGTVNADDHVSPAKLMKELESIGFRDVSWRMSAPGIGIVMAWK